LCRIIVCLSLAHCEEKPTKKPLWKKQKI
jgi:hypothetical protein